MKGRLKIIMASLFLLIALGVTTELNSSPPPPPCDCCYTEHDSNCLNCEGGITLFSYNCGTIDPIKPRLD